MDLVVSLHSQPFLELLVIHDYLNQELGCRRYHYHINQELGCHRYHYHLGDYMDYGHWDAEVVECLEAEVVDYCYDVVVDCYYPNIIVNKSIVTSFSSICELIVCITRE